MSKLAEIGLSKLILIGLALVIIIGGGIFAFARKNAQRLTSKEADRSVAIPSPESDPSDSPPTASPVVASPQASPSAPAKATASPKAATSPSPQSSQETNSQTQDTQSPTSKSNQPVIQHLGVVLDYYNASTGMAGDFKFTKATLHDNRLWMDYAYTITQTNTGSPKRNPQPTFILPMGTKVRSLVDGKVFAVPKLYSNDYSIQVQRTDGSQYIYETEHVINPLVSVGDTVKAGQIIAEVSPHDSHYNDGMGLVEIGILSPSGSEPQHICPFAYLDPSIKSDLQAKITAFYKSWEEYRGADYYDDGAYPMPGCQTLDLIAG